MTTTNTPVSSPPLRANAAAVARDERPENRLRPRAFRRSDAIDLVGAAAGSLCLTWLIYERLTPLSGALGFCVAWYAVFLTTAWFIARERIGPIQARDRLVGIVVATVGLGMLIPLGLIVGYTIARGYQRCDPSSSRRTRATSGR
ncbi:MAG: hypothetical protein M3Q30_24910 [Actinomycetota bacterium]|nr:hypothetical protein [Actinomycetota bacterium]